MIARHHYEVHATSGHFVCAFLASSDVERRPFLSLVLATRRYPLRKYTLGVLRKRRPLGNFDMSIYTFF